MKVTAALACFVADAGLATAQEAMFIPEAFPPHIEARLVEQDAFLLTGLISASDQAYLERLKLWDPSQTIQVCFFGGSPQLRVRIAQGALEWTKLGGNVNLDFGSGPVPPDCGAGDYYEARVGFGYDGYWSLRGRDSVNLAPQSEQSMNFEMFDVNPLPEPEFTRVVIHEFGHLVGFIHEHQSPYSDCESEFNWPAVYAYLGGPPNNWPQSRVDSQLRAKIVSSPVASGFDARSVMLYTFPSEFYVNGTSSRCYHAPNYRISDLDRAAVRQLYPADAAEASAIREDALNNVIVAIGNLDAPLDARVAAQAVVAATVGDSFAGDEGAGASFDIQNFGFDQFSRGITISPSSP